MASTVKVGDRVKLTAPMLNPNSASTPVEKDMPVGVLGTVVYVSLEGPKDLHQIGVRWDNGKTLNILPDVDSFVVVKDPADEDDEFDTEE